MYLRYLYFWKRLRQMKFPLFLLWQFIRISIWKKRYYVNKKGNASNCKLDHWYPLSPESRCQAAGIPTSTVSRRWLCWSVLELIRLQKLCRTMSPLTLARGLLNHRYGASQVIKTFYVSFAPIHPSVCDSVGSNNLYQEIYVLWTHLASG